MNNLAIHPLLVHFPIALWSLYTFFEVVRIPFFTRRTYLFYVKTALIIFGTIAAVPTILAGKLMEGAYTGSGHDLVEMHERFGLLSSVVYGLLAVLYLCVWAGQEYPRFAVLGKIAGVFYKPWLVVGLAVIGFILVSVTGALGNSLVRGPHSEPFSALVYWLLFGR